MTTAQRRSVGRVSLEGFVSWWAGSAYSARRRRRALAVWLLVVCAAVAAVGVPRLRIFGHDIFVSLDGGWRVLNGQRPGVDFYGQMEQVIRNHLVRLRGPAGSSGPAEA